MAAAVAASSTAAAYYQFLEHAPLGVTLGYFPFGDPAPDAHEEPLRAAVWFYAWSVAPGRPADKPPTEG